MPNPISKPPVTSDPSNPVDIYDPNLTPEQVASLSPEDREIRNEVLGAVERGGLANLDEDGGITVVAKRPVPPAPLPEPEYDWRVKLSLAPGSKYLYNAKDPGILEPLKQTNGVIFPYLPQITVTYSANYNTTDIVHTNYKIYQYASSSVDTVNIVGDFTAQDTKEARYLLSVIHFFRTATKMFFGQDGKDETPRAGTPPPLCFLKGLGSYQFSEHPLVITTFSYTLPNDVDYIPTTGPDRYASRFKPEPIQWKSSRIPDGRLPDEILPGGQRAGPNFSALPDQAAFNQISYVPSKITLNINCLPVVSRASLADNYSTKDYASGKAYLKDGGRFW